MEFVKELILNRINGKLREKKLTQKDLAKVLGVRDQTVSNKIGGKTEFTLSELLQIGEYLDIKFHI